jgi:glycosyltransferase involved in cell wall biosynthesis
MVSHRGKSFSLWIVGDGRQKHELLQRVKELNIQDAVHFFGSVPYQDVGCFYSACDVFVLPTLQDYRSVAVMEAAKHGRAILDSMHDGGATEFVHNGENGFIFDPRDPSELANFMLRLIDTPGLAKCFGKKSLEIMKPYSVENAIAAFCDSVDRL